MTTRYRLAFRPLAALRGPLDCAGQGLDVLVREAVAETDLMTAGLIDYHEAKDKDTVIDVSPETMAKLRQAAHERAFPVTGMVNTALAHWFARRGQVLLQ